MDKPAHGNEPQWIRTHKNGSVLEIVFDRPKERNAFHSGMLLQLSAAYTELEDSVDVHCGLVYAEGKHFTLGLELDEVSAFLKKNKTLPLPEGGVDPWDVTGRIRKKPVVVASHGFCFTLGIELMLAADVRIASPGSRFAQVEVGRGIMPFGGGTMRWVRDAGWGNAMRYILTGEAFGVEVALRLGLIQEIVERDQLIARGRELASLIAKQAPLAVQATRLSARRYLTEGFDSAAAALLSTTMELMQTSDADEGVQSFKENRPPEFKGR